MSTLHTLSFGNIPAYFDQSEDLLRRDFEELSESGTLHLLCDENTYALCLPLIPFLAGLTRTPIMIPSGEEHKTLRTCEHVWHTLMSQQADRRSTLINLGGGVLTDLGGFCAATYLRGINFVHIPTTLLAMGDAAFGGKQGVDFEGLKNYIGIVRQPASIWVDTRFLRTLPVRHVRNGMAEIVKHALIGDRELFHLLEALEHGALPLRWQEILIRAITVKKQFVEADIYEYGVRAALNFGHTFGHALESWSLTTTHPLLHGECVAQGMIFETWLSHFYLGTPDREECRRATALIQKWTPVEIGQNVNFNELVPFLMMDKKHRGGIPRFSLIRGIGHVEIGQVVDAPVIQRLISDPEVMQAMPWLKP